MGTCIHDDIAKGDSVRNAGINIVDPDFVDLFCPQSLVNLGSAARNRSRHPLNQVG